jgi:hypothetical protein
VGLNVYERWLLEMVVELRYPLSVLGHPAIDLHLNRPGPGITCDALAEHLEQLHAGGLIELIELRGDDSHPIMLSLAGLREAIRNAAQDAGERGPSQLSDGVYFGLTAEGGRVWETFARPDWRRFLCDEIGDDVVVTAQDRARIEEYLDGTRGRGWRRGDEAWTVHEPWQATYWKTLSAGFSCRYRAAIDEEIDPLLIDDGWFREFRQWFARVALPAPAAGDAS